MPNWIKIANLNELSEQTGKVFDLEGIPVALFKRGSEVYAVDPSCPHQGGPLDEGGTHDGKVMCPWHGWEFDLATGTCDFNDEIQVKTYPVMVKDSDVFIAFS